MKTSYFFSYKLTNEMDLVSVAGLTPKEIKEKFKNIRQYDFLKPPKQLVVDYKSKKISQKEYTRIYNEQLSKLDPVKVYNDLKNSVILCWEKPKDFCHRKLIAKWIYDNTSNIVEEL